MTKVSIKKKNNNVYEIVIKGHSKYEEYGKDIVCASISTMAITTINSILCLEEESIDYEEKTGLLKISVLKDTEVVNKLLDNLHQELNEVHDMYPKNIEIRNEE